MYRGWSVNLSLADLRYTFGVEFPSAPLFEATEGPVIELVFWSVPLGVWVHVLRTPFERQLPNFHIQLSFEQGKWLEGLVAQRGFEALPLGVKALLG